MTLLVSADPGLKTENTKIDEVHIGGSSEATFAIFTDTGQTKDVEVGATLGYAHVEVFIAKEYAANETEAKAKTRVTVTIKDPEEATVFDGEMNPWIIVTDWGDYWEVQYDGIDTPHDLVEGIYTVTIKYEIEV